MCCSMWNKLRQWDSWRFQGGCSFLAVSLVHVIVIKRPLWPSPHLVGVWKTSLLQRLRRRRFGDLWEKNQLSGGRRRVTRRQPVATATPSLPGRRTWRGWPSAWPLSAHPGSGTQGFRNGRSYSRKLTAPPPKNKQTRGLGGRREGVADFDASFSPLVVVCLSWSILF